MPIYEYQCECGNEQDLRRSVDERNSPVACKVCGKGMALQWSAPCPAVMKPTGKGMALDSLNSGHGFPKGPEGALATKAAAAGLEEAPRRFY